MIRMIRFHNIQFAEDFAMFFFILDLPTIDKVLRSVDVNTTIPCHPKRLAFIGIIREGFFILFYPLNSKVPTIHFCPFFICFYGENYFTGPIIFATALL